MFDTLADLDAFFTDDVLDVGYVTDPTMTVDLSCAIDLAAGAAWGFSYVFGTQPTLPGPPPRVPASSTTLTPAESAVGHGG
jgi:hypothetical protein